MRSTPGNCHRKCRKVVCNEGFNVLPGKEIELVPRVGNHIIYLGKLEHFEDKLKRLKTFYEKGLNQVGWNKYSRISLEFGNQIICTKKKQ